MVSLVRLVIEWGRANAEDLGYYWVESCTPQLAAGINKAIQGHNGAVVEVVYVYSSQLKLLIGIDER